MKYTLIHADAWLLVLDKPSGQLSVPGKGPDLQACLARDVQADFPGARNVHRLDRDTSGLIVMARDADTHRALSAQFAARRVEKVYEALVAGVPDAAAGVIEQPLARDLARPPRHRVDTHHGRPATTQWRVVAVESGDARLELRPQTGRSHQLRVHLAWLGHPILGDPLYADPAAEARYPRLGLHATQLAFEHPATGARLHFHSPPPWTKSTRS